MTNPSPYGEYPNYPQPPQQQQQPAYPSQPYEPYPQQQQQAYPSYAPPQYGEQPPMQGYPPQPGYPPQYPTYMPGTGPTSGMAIASLVCSLLGISLVGVILGHVALHQIKQSNGYTQGRGLAIAGLIIGYIQIALGVLFIAIIVIAAMTNPGGTSTY